MGIQAGGLHGPFDSTLEHRRVEVMSPSLPGFWIDVHAGGRKDPLPADLPSRGRVLSRQGERKLDPSCAALQIVGMKAPYALEMNTEPRVSRLGEESNAITVPLPAPHDQLARAEVDVLHA